MLYGYSDWLGQIQACDWTVYDGPAVRGHVSADPQLQVRLKQQAPTRQIGGSCLASWTRRNTQLPESRLKP